MAHPSVEVWLIDIGRRRLIGVKRRWVVLHRGVATRVPDVGSSTTPHRRGSPTLSHPPRLRLSLLLAALPGVDRVGVRASARTERLVGAHPNASGERRFEVDVRVLGQVNDEDAGPPRAVACGTIQLVAGRPADRVPRITPRRAARPGVPRRAWRSPLLEAMR
jgi:hypothetical protein